MVISSAPSLRTLILVAGGIASGFAADVPPTAPPSASGLHVAQVFSDHAVLQRERPVPVWGWASPGAPVTVALAGQQQHAIAAGDGRWQVTFDALHAGGPALELVATSGTATAKAVDLLVGEVWLCSGQSNMAFPVKQADQAQAELAGADLPMVRLLNVPQRATAVPSADIDASWTICTPATASYFSAVGFFFGRELAQNLAMPIGLINASWGGTPAQSWTSYQALAADPALAGYAASFDISMSAYPAAVAASAAVPPVRIDDRGWQTAAPEAGEWQDMTLPQN